MNFLQTLTKQVTKKPIVESKKESTISAPKKLAFTHSNNVIIKTGSYKGYYGTVYKVQPARYELLIPERKYIYVKDYGVKQIGTKIFTEFGESTIIDRIPVLFNIIDKISGESLRYSEALIRRVVVFSDKRTLKIGLLSGVQKIDDKVVYVIRPYNLVYQKTDKVNSLMSELRNKLVESRDHDSLLNKRVYKHSDEVEDLIEKLEDSLTFDEETDKNMFMYVESDKIHSDMLMIVADDVNMGTYGELSHIIDEQYLIEHNTFSLTPQSIVKPRNAKIGDDVTIMFGAMKNKTGTVIGVYPEIITVFVEAAGKKIDSVHVMEKNGLNMRPLTSEDVFYMDIRLNNGNYFQVQTILENGNFIGLEGARELIPREISSNDIERFQTGFSYKPSSVKSTEDFEIESTGPELVDVEEIEVSEEQEPEDTGEIDVEKEIGYEEEETEETQEDEMGEPSSEAVDETREEGEEKLMSSFRDVERTQVVVKKLSKEERSIRKMIISIFTAYEITESDFRVNSLVASVKSFVDKIQNEINKVMDDYWKLTDEKYVVACIVLYELIRLRNIYLYLSNLISDDMLNKYINKLITEVSFFSETDIQGSVFLKSGWTDAFNVNNSVVKSLVKKRDYRSVYKLMLENCHAIIQKFSTPDEKIEFVQYEKMDENELIPLAINRKQPYVPKIIYSKDILSYSKEQLSGDIPETINKIIWGPQFQSIIENYKMTLQNKIVGNEYDTENDTWVKAKRKPNKTTVDVYKYVLENLEQAPIALRELKKILQKTKLKKDESKFLKLQKIFMHLVEEIRRKEKESKSLKRKQMEKILEKESETTKRREEISIRNKLLGLTLEPEDDQEPEIELEQLRPRRRRRF